MRLFEVGGCVRDSFLGVKSKDIDIAVECSGWDEMLAFVEERADKVFLAKPEFLTIRALWPELGPLDFVLCRKDGEYSDGRRPDSVETGTIFDDLARRDFTMNAIAKDLNTGEIIDPHGGIQDIEKRLIRCVGKAEDRFSEDALRILRAFRFHITKDFFLDADIQRCMRNSKFVNMLDSVSEERIQVELAKCLKHDTFKTIESLSFLRQLSEKIFSRNLWLEPTLKQR